MAYFNLHSGTGNTNYHAFSLQDNSGYGQNYHLPAAPNGTKLVVTKLGFDTGGYSDSGSIDFRIWASSSLTDTTATQVYTSGTLTVPSDYSTAPRVEYIVPSSSYTTTDLTGGNYYMFGVSSTSTNFYVQRQVNTGYDVYYDASLTSTGDFSATDSTSYANFTLIGRIDYIYLPDPPGWAATAITGGTRSIAIDWTAPADDGDNSYPNTGITAYRYQISTNSSFTAIVKDVTTTSGSATITTDTAGNPLLDSTTYYARVSARNVGFAALGESWSTTRSATTSAPAANPPVFTDTDLTTDLRVGTPVGAGEAIAATQTTYYSVSGETEVNASGGSGTGYYTVVPGVFLNKTTGTISGTPTTYDENVPVTFVATGPTGTDTFSTTFTVEPRFPVFTAIDPPGGRVNVDYSYTFAADYDSTIVLNSGTLPDGLTLSTAGVISGVPTTNASYTFTLKATTVSLNTYTISPTINLVIGAGGPWVMKDVGGVLTPTRSIVKVWDGTDFVVRNTYVWNGTAFVPLK